MDGNTQHKKRSPETATIAWFLITFGTFLSSWAHPGEDLGGKGIPSGFQRPLLDDFWWIWVPIGHHFWTLLDPKLTKRLFWDTCREVLGHVLKNTSTFIWFLTLSNPLDGAPSQAIAQFSLFHHSPKSIKKLHKKWSNNIYFGHPCHPKSPKSRPRANIFITVFW